MYDHLNISTIQNGNINRISDGKNVGFSFPVGCGNDQLMCKESCVDDTSFKYISVLGTGAYGKVILVRKRGGPDHNQLFAMKVLVKDAILQKAKMVEHVLSERTILEAIRPSKLFVNLHYAFQSQTKLHLVMDYVSGGELFTHLQRHHQLNEDHVRFYVAEMILALSFLHNLKIIYRDLKLENVMLDKLGHIVLTDFGLSKIFLDDDEVCRTFSFCGTIEYMAPEIIHVGPKGYSFAVDWWSLGVITFELMGGKSPFIQVNQNRRSHMDITTQITRAPLPKISGTTPGMRDLIEKLMMRTPSKRLGFKGASQICRHRFFKTIDWTKLERRQITPPVVPVLKSETDTKYFLKEFTQQSVKDNECHMPPKSSNLFLDYEFNSDSMTSTESSALFKCDRPRMGHMHKTSENSHFFEKYELFDKCGYFGEGATSVVRRCGQRNASVEFAVKIKRREYHKTNEIEELAKLQGHPCIVNLIEVKTDQTFAYIVMEPLEGGELLQRAVTDGLFRIKHAKIIMMTLIYALRFMHSCAAVHGNFRPEKVVLIDDGDIPNVKIVGLDSSKKPTNSLISHSMTASDQDTPNSTVIPANNFRRMLESMDWWGMGVIMYVLVYGTVPILEEGPKDLRLLFADNFEQVWGQESQLNQDFYELTLGLLSTDWQKRANAWEKLVDGNWLHGKHMFYRLLLSPNGPKHRDLLGIKRLCDNYLGADGTLVTHFIGSSDVAKRLKPFSSPTSADSCEPYRSSRFMKRSGEYVIEEIIQHPLASRPSARKLQSAVVKKSAHSSRGCKLTKCEDSRIKTPIKSTHHMKLRSAKHSQVPF